MQVVSKAYFLGKIKKIFQNVVCIKRSGFTFREGNFVKTVYASLLERGLL